MAETANYAKVSADECNAVTEDSVALVPPITIEGDGTKGIKKETAKAVGLFALFRFADGLDKCLMAVGLFCATINGASMPIWAILFGEMIETFTRTGAFMEYLGTISDFIQSHNKSLLFYVSNPDKFTCSEIVQFYGGNKTCSADIAHSDTILDAMANFSIYFCGTGVAVLIVGYIQVVCWMTAAERQAYRIRHACLLNVLRQDIGWFDTHAATELNTRLADDVQKIQDGIGDKVATFWQWSSGTIIGIIAAFLYGWKLTLVVLAASPILAISTAVFGQLSSRISSKSLAAYAKAGSIAEEVFGSIRTVVAFGGQEKEADRYRKHLSDAEAAGIQKGLANGISMGLLWCVLYSLFGLSFWYGGKLFREDDDYDAGNVVVVIFSVLLAAYSVGMAAPSVEIISAGRGAAYIVFQLIDIKSAIDSTSEEGFTPNYVNGKLELLDVHFSYPSRSDVKVLDGVSLEAKPGQTVALVGASGCGKSTIVQLLLRFYDSQKGKVMIDGMDIRSFNVKWLRQNIGLVSQEPVLFATTIAENIRYGKEDVTMDEIVEACKKANAATFIKELPDGYDTMVGERGCQLSGGQKQRLAIARALVRDPKILLLDEATSALDTESESIVQDALDKSCQGRTTIVVAHRLSTIKNVDFVVGIDGGKVAEIGNHEELMEKRGIYYQLVMNQQSSTLDKVKAAEEMDNASEVENVFLTNVNDTAQKKDEVEEKTGEDLPPAPFKRLMKLIAPEWYFVAIGCFASLVAGLAWPVYGVLVSNVMKVFAYVDDDKQKRDMMKFSLLGIGNAVTAFVANVLLCYMFSLSGEALTTRLRDNSFRTMLKQDMSFYDVSQNNVGALTTKLAMDASLVQGITGIRLGSALMGLSSVLAALTLGFYHGWKMAFVVLAFLPLMTASGLLSVRLVSGQAGRNKKALEEATKISVEITGNIKTVASLTLESKFLNSYMEKLKPPYMDVLKKSHIVGILFGLGQAMHFFSYAVAFYFGARMVEDGEMTFHDVFMVFYAIIIGAMGLGFASAFIPDIGKAQMSARRIFQILDSKSAIDYTSCQGRVLDVDYKAEITFEDVQFHYPNRKSVKVLRGMTFSVVPGQTVALVGASGCGKSTSVQLIGRFYDCDAGKVALDSNAVTSLNLKWLREQIGIVSQEPVLFDKSIAENIAYGDNTRSVSMEEIISAARSANIHSFIASLPDGYETNVGLRGTQLSGGQKQRIAIARALVRNPKILLLDEATSALDTESEKIVQEALDKAREGRTCVIIAHRLSTIQNADQICVINNGKMEESGTHSELMAKQGLYNKLVKRSVKEM